MTPTDRPRAADVAAFFDGARLTLGRQLAGLRKSDLAQYLEMSPTAVAAWESGAKRPTAVTVARLALSLGVDPGFFAMRPDDVAALSATPHFRSLRSTTQLARDQAFAYGQLAVDIATSLEKHVECPAPDVPSFPVPIDAAGRDIGGPGAAGPVADVSALARPQTAHGGGVMALGAGQRHRRRAQLAGRHQEDRRPCRRR